MSTENVLAMSLIKGFSRRMAWTIRYSTHRRLHEESVAEHSWFVAFYSLAIYDSIEKKWPNISTFVNLEHLMRRAVLHDLDEAVTGDVVRPFKYNNAKLTALFKETSQNVLSSYLEDECLPVSYVDTVSCAKNGYSGVIVALADLISVISLQIEEYYMGNTYAYTVLTDVSKYLQDIVKKVATFNFRFKEFVENLVNNIEDIISAIKG